MMVITSKCMHDFHYFLNFVLLVIMFYNIEKYDGHYFKMHTHRPRAALLMCQKKYSAIGNSAIGNYVVLYSKLILKTVLLEVSYGKNDLNSAIGGLLEPIKNSAIWKSVLREAVLREA